MHSRIVGLTGGIGSGKSVVAQRFAELGVPVVDTDEIAHCLTAAGGMAMPAIEAAFGSEAVEASGAMNRTVIRARVFEDPAQRAVLEGILHPLIFSESMRELEASRHDYAILAVPLLFRSPRYTPVIWRALLVDCDESLQLQRVMQRSALPEAQIRAIMATQLTRAERQALANDIIVNNGSLDALRLQVDQKHRYYHEILAAGH